MSGEIKMKKRKYTCPTTETYTLKYEGFLCLSVPIGSGGGPGGGGDAKHGFFDEEQEDENGELMKRVTPWKYE